MLQGVGAVQRIIQLQLYVADYIVVTPFGLNGRAQQRCRARDERDHDVEKSDRRHRKSERLPIRDDSQRRTTDDAHREYPLTSYTSVR